GSALAGHTDAIVRVPTDDTAGAGAARRALDTVGGEALSGNPSPLGPDAVQAGRAGFARVASGRSEHTVGPTRRTRDTAAAGRVPTLHARHLRGAGTEDRGRTRCCVRRLVSHAEQGYVRVRVDTSGETLNDGTSPTGATSFVLE